MTTYERIYRAVRRVPRGRVATYGQIAEIAKASGPRQVGYALHALPEGHDLPWHRILASGGRIALPEGSPSRQRQIERIQE